MHLIKLLYSKSAEMSISPVFVACHSHVESWLDRNYFVSYMELPTEYWMFCFYKRILNLLMKFLEAWTFSQIQCSKKIASQFACSLCTFFFFLASTKEKRTAKIVCLEMWWMLHQPTQSYTHMIGPTVWVVKNISKTIL